jgi:alpha-galactosidase
MGTDLTKLTQAQIALLQNKYLLGFNQDPIIGKPATPYKWGINPDWTFNSTAPAQYWSGATSNGTTLVAMFNPLNKPLHVSAVFDEIPQLEAGACYHVVNVWTGKDMGCREGHIDVKLAANDTAVYSFEGKC